jgi:uncharacterized protein YbcV (DUF1398 family)
MTKTHPVASTEPFRTDALSCFPRQDEFIQAMICRKVVFAGSRVTIAVAGITNFVMHISNKRKSYQDLQSAKSWIPGFGKTTN